MHITGNEELIESEQSIMEETGGTAKNDELTTLLAICSVTDKSNLLFHNSFSNVFH